MKDGVRLSATLYKPMDTPNKKFPAILKLARYRGGIYKQIEGGTDSS